jgi:N-acetylmuramoyl-L-alanine amidase
MIDIDGTVYQTLDVKERAWHAGELNSRSIGIEIANIGAYPLNSPDPNASAPLKEWYRRMPDGRTRIVMPAGYDTGGVRTSAFVGYPARPDPVYGSVHGVRYRQYDFTPEQYESLVRLTAALCTIFPKITCDYPRQRADLGPPATQPAANLEATTLPTMQVSALAGPNEPGYLIPTALTPAQLDAFHGILAHYHITTLKVDPGPAFNWDYVINNARSQMGQ